ncbi:hypothetical protein F5Y17DRAFT_415456 [Xylariaceae sp. FL0594]|nr:hypothetical protein F5Y17DRAFT_415456 [Xylariaceae sp. FL0594]
MYRYTIIGFFLAALAAASPSSRSSTSVAQPRRGDKTVTFVMTEPDCDSLKDYCTSCNGDFTCETDPRCEWCYENDEFPPRN